MWKSPIEIQIEAVQQELVKKEEQLVLNTVQGVICRVINKQQLIDALNYDSKQYSAGYTDGMEQARRQIIAAIEEDFDIEYWLDDVISTIKEAVPSITWLADPPDPPDDCDYEIGYDPFIGSTTYEV